MERWQIKITGRVQGVGFRPTVVRLAETLGLTGTVGNDTQGVTLELQGRVMALGVLVQRLQGSDKPPLAVILTCETQVIPLVACEQSVVVIASETKGDLLSEVTVDTAVCGDCRRELADPQDFRYRYPFINCTNCGPRYSIIKAIPYDRPLTTMAAFPMCERCSQQYTDVRDRRFHAQPVACAQCGPRLWLATGDGVVLAEGNDTCLGETAALLRTGKIVAIKGLGGFHLAVDAHNQEAVLRLRRRKQRDHKPFALMTDTVEKIRRYVELDATTESLLRSPESPIVLLDRKSGTTLAPAVAVGMSTLGFMLAYTPLHVLLFSEGLDVLVMTSGNLSDEPLICDNDRALERLSTVADAFLMHDREIYRQVDDSIVQVVGLRVQRLRRSRGYMPQPIRMTRTAQRPILAMGADLKNTFCLAVDKRLICSEHLGDLADAVVYRHYVQSIKHLCGLFDVEPQFVVCDLHPGYLSTQYAHRLAIESPMQVQHHWAHIAAVLAEHQFEGTVIGLVADGTGYGPDGTIWGGECLLASLTHFERVGCIRPFTLAGGDRASKEAIRPLLGLLQQVYADDMLPESVTSLLLKIEPDPFKLKTIQQQLAQGLNCVTSTSLGRVFDAVAALLGVGDVNHFDAQLPMALESLSASKVEAVLPFELFESEQGGVFWDWIPMMRALIEARLDGTGGAELAAKFHNTLAQAFCELALAIRKQCEINTVALSGGVFCNRYLSERLERSLQQAGFEVLCHRQLPPNDGCIAVGQAAIACRKLSH